MENNQYKILESALKQYDEVESVYVNSDYSDGNRILNCNVVCNIENIASNAELLKGIVANLEIIKLLFKKSNLLLNYSIISEDIFKEDLEDSESDTYRDYLISSIIYTKGRKRIK